jgi:hypothetical protein
MNEKSLPGERPTLEEVRQRFEQWREHRKRRTPIPKSLWEGAVRLCADHSLFMVSRSLRLDYNALKRRLCSFRPDPEEVSLRSSDFVTLDVAASPRGGECIVEMEKAGARMRMHLKGEIGVYPLEVIRTFWGLR